MKKLYICDSERKIKDKKCTGIACKLFDNCYMTFDKEYAKEYVSEEEIRKYYADYDVFFTQLKDYEMSEKCKIAFANLIIKVDVSKPQKQEYVLDIERWYNDK